MYLFLILNISEAGRNTDDEGRKRLSILSVAIRKDRDDAAFPLKWKYNA